MCAKVFHLQGEPHQKYLIFLLFHSVPLTIGISTVSAGWISPLSFHCFYVYENLFGIMGMYILDKRMIVKRSARQIGEVKLVLKLQFNSFLYVG